MRTGVATSTRSSHGRLAKARPLNFQRERRRKRCPIPTSYNRRYRELRDEAVRQEQMDGQVPETDMERYRAEVLRKVQDALSSITADVMIKYEAP